MIFLFVCVFFCTKKSTNRTVKHSSSSSASDKCEVKQTELFFFALSLQINEWSMQTHAISYRLNCAHRTQVLMPFINSWKLPQTRYDYKRFFASHFEFQLLPVTLSWQPDCIFNISCNIHKVEILRIPPRYRFYVFIFINDVYCMCTAHLSMHLLYGRGWKIRPWMSHRIQFQIKLFWTFQFTFVSH